MGWLAKIGFPFAVILLIVTFNYLSCIPHEGGHYIAYSLLGYKPVGLYIHGLPLVKLPSPSDDELHKRKGDCFFQSSESAGDLPWYLSIFAKAGGMMLEGAIMLLGIGWLLTDRLQRMKKLRGVLIAALISTFFLEIYLHVLLAIKGLASDYLDFGQIMAISNDNLYPLGWVLWALTILSLTILLGYLVKRYKNYMDKNWTDFSNTSLWIIVIITTILAALASIGVLERMGQI